MSASSFDSLISGKFRTELKFDFWPATDASSKKLLVVLHGRGDSAEGFHWLPEQLNIEAFNYLFLNAPDPFYAGFSWYDVPPNQAPGIVRSRALLTKLCDDLMAECQLKATDIFLFGFSQGCLMSIDLALRYRNVLGGIVALSGYVFFMDEYPEAFSTSASKQRIFASHGYQDDVLPFQATHESIEKLKALGVHIDWNAYNKAHTIDPDSELSDIREFLTRLLECS